MKQIKAISKLLFERNFTNKEICYYNGYACFISILDFDNEEQKYDYAMENFLQVKMWDIEEDLISSNGKKYEKPSDVELQKIVDFVNKHKDKVDFVIHCSAGISRSGAVANFIQHKFYNEVDKDKFMQENKYIQPNLLILRRLKELDNKGNASVK